MTTALAAEIDRLAAPAGGRAGVYAEHIETGRTVGLNAAEPFPMASTYKVAIAGTVLHGVGTGTLALGQLVTVDDAHRVASDVIASKFPHTGIALSVHNLLEVMLTDSDNTATDVLLDLIGGPGTVTGWLRSIGNDDQRVDRSTRDLINEFFGLKSGQSLRQAFEERPELEALGISPNPAYDDAPQDTSTPMAMVQLLTGLYRDEVLRRDLCDVLLATLTRCTTGNARIRGLLPAGTIVANKTGTIGGTVNDVGIITLPDGSHIAIAVFLKKTDTPFDLRERAIAEIARTVHDAFLLT